LGSLIERVEAKEIAMDSPRWAGTSVTDLAEIVPALDDGELWLLDNGPWLERRRKIRRDSLVERRDAGRQVVKYPVRPGSPRCIGIVTDQDQRAGSLRNARPFQGRGPVRAVAGELPRDHASLGESRAGQADRLGSRIEGGQCASATTAWR